MDLDIFCEKKTYFTFRLAKHSVHATRTCSPNNVSEQFPSFPKRTLKCWKRGNYSLSGYSSRLAMHCMMHRAQTRPFHFNDSLSFKDQSVYLRDVTYATWHNKWAWESSWHYLFWLHRRRQIFSSQSFQRTMKWDSLFNLFTLYKITHWAQYRHSGYLILAFVQFHFLQKQKTKLLHHNEGLFPVFDNDKLECAVDGAPLQVPTPKFLTQPAPLSPTHGAWPQHPNENSVQYVFYHLFVRTHT